jgi:tetratricopeptide (TPR) repeat protein
MRRFRLGFGAVLALALVPSLAAAQEPAAPAAPAKEAPAADKAAPATAAAPKAPAEGEPRRDPKGIKGISPFWEAVNKGDKAFVARDFDAAIAAYREAITASPQNALGHYRMGEAQLAKGNPAEAEQSWDAGLRFAGEDAVLRAKLLFVLADLRERQKALDEAKARWEQYEKFVQQSPESKGFAATPPERKKRIDDWKKTSGDSVAVKERIEKRLKEAEEAARKSAK